MDNDNLLRVAWKNRASIVLFLLGILIFSYFANRYLLAWHIGYSSDTAMLGLMAKHILEFGERPIFVWSVGYQGVWLEAYLSAVFFKLYGINPVVNNFAPTLYLILALGVWTHLLIKEFNAFVGSLTLVLAVSCFPMFYQLFQRTLPNFSEVFLLGGLSFSLFFRLVRHHETSQVISRRALCLLGFVLGFALYTFAISGYFAIAIGLATAIMLSRPQQLQKLRSKATLLLFPWMDKNRFGRKKIFVSLFTFFAWVLLISGIVMMFLMPAQFQFQQRTIKSNPMAVLCGGAVLLLLPMFISFLRSLPAKTSQFYCTVAWLGSSFVVGYFPALLYKLVYHGSSKKPMGINGDWSTLMARINTFWTFHLSLFRSSSNLLNMIILLLLLISLIFFARTTLKKTLAYLSNPQAALPKELPFLLFMLIVPPIFFVARMVVDMASMRYLIYLSFFYSLAIAYFIDVCWQRWARFRLLILGLALISVNAGVSSIKSDLETPYDQTFQQISTMMESHALKLGYSDYWYAYATTFLTNEDIILEPIYSNYSPHYGPLVQSANTVAYIENIGHPKAIKINGDQTLEIFTQKYKIVFQENINRDLRFNILERLKL